MIDTSTEDWQIYKKTNFPSRLVSHTVQKKNVANMKLVELVLSSRVEKLIILKAIRDIILPFNQLRFD